MEFGTDEYLQSCLVKYKVENVMFRGEKEDGWEDGDDEVWLCMQQASGDGLDLPVASNGQGHTREVALREAQMNLIHSLRGLSRT